MPAHGDISRDGRGCRIASHVKAILPTKADQYGSAQELVIVDENASRNTLVYLDAVEDVAHPTAQIIGYGFRREHDLKFGLSLANKTKKATRDRNLLAASMSPCRWSRNSAF